ncbi:MAG TPA: KGK domain-containing protein [Nodularia sp. (in: cyanobacteria)]|nr:KGK domain-containing protein [Nodularia sp. (in: cyanobacteria)]
MDLQNGDVVHMNSGNNLGAGSTSRISEIRENVRSRFVNYGDWVSDDGAKCKLLREGGKWQVGRIRLKLEFTPDEPDSPLDELRSDLNI